MKRKRKNINYYVEHNGKSYYIEHINMRRSEKEGSKRYIVINNKLIEEDKIYNYKNFIEDKYIVFGEPINLIDKIYNKKDYVNKLRESKRKLTKESIERERIICTNPLPDTLLICLYNDNGLDYILKEIKEHKERCIRSGYGDGEFDYTDILNKIKRGDI